MSYQDALPYAQLIEDSRTEVGQLMTSARPREDKAWNYLRPLKGRREYMRFDEVAPNTYELIVLDGLPSKVASNSHDPPNSFHTSDTFSPHTSIPDAWKYLGRIDDRITLVNGEKVLPITIENQIRDNEYVHECWVVGIGRALPGIMIVPSTHAEGLTKEQILEKVWPSIQTANSRVEGFSQISKEMTEILPIGTDYPQTDKGTMIRARTYVKFAKEIDDLYHRFENGTGTKLTLSQEELENWLLNAFKERMGTNIALDADTDLYAAGVDSLQAISIFGLIKREIDVGDGEVVQNVVFEQPTIKSLTAHLYSLRTGETFETKDEISVMRGLIEKYSVFEQHRPGTSKVTKECIVSESRPAGISTIHQQN